MAEKNKLVKNVTIDELAVIINKGFDGQMDYLKEQFGHIDKRFDQVDKRIEKVEESLGEVKTVLTDAHVL